MSQSRMNELLGNVTDTPKEWSFTETYTPLLMRALIVKSYPPSDMSGDPITMTIISHVSLDTVSKKLIGNAKVKFPSGKILIVKSKKEMDEDELKEAIDNINDPIERYIRNIHGIILEEKEIEFEKTDKLDQIIKKIDESGIFNIGVMSKN